MPPRVADLEIVATCKPCRLRQINTSSTEEEFGPTDAETVFVFVHGGGGSRAMFREHAKALVESRNFTFAGQVSDDSSGSSAADHLKQRGGVRCVLLDLPGHGSRHQQECAVTTCVDAVVQTGVAARRTAPAGARIIYVGGSLGGYVGMEAMRCDDFCAAFDAAIIMCASQTTGVGAGVAARAGLSMMGWMVGGLGKTGFVKMMLQATKASKHVDDSLVWGTCFEPGMFFDSAPGQIAILRESDPLPGVRNFARSVAERQGKGQDSVVFMYGSTDHHDNSAKLAEAAEAAGSREVVYKGGDHFFTHDRRFANSVLAELRRVASSR